MPTQKLATDYAQRGWPVLPIHTFDDGHCTCGDVACRSKAKHPITVNGVKDASTDPEVIQRWMIETDGQANIGIATGNGLLVLDIDSKSGGFESLAVLEGRFGRLPITPTVQTGGGGKHYYFSYPEGSSIGNKAAIVPGIDIRGMGGYVVAPPSKHSSGQPYRWEMPSDTPLAPSPPWLLDGLANPQLLSGPPAAPAPRGMILRVQVPTPDLSTAPGVPEGERHARLCQLVGISLARGESVEAIEASALAWGSRCEPPMDEGEVLQTVKSIAAKHQAQRGSSLILIEPDDLDTTPLPAPKEWPELHPDALHGLSGEIIRTLSPHTEADPAGVLMTLLACFGNAVGKGPYIGVGADSHHTNLFVGLVGDTASGKGQAWGIARSLMRSADPQWEAECVGYGLSSGEGLVERVKDDDPDEGGEGHILAIPAERRLLCYESEFAKPITAMRREGNTLSALLRAAWDSQTLEVMTRGKSKLKATNAHIGIVAHITPDELSKLLSGSVEIANGFANRFLWGHVRRSRLLPHGGDPGILDAFAQPLAQALAYARAIGRVQRDPEADRLWERVYASLAEARPGAFGRATERARPQVLRLALIYALLDGSTTMTARHLGSALAVWRYSQASARLIFGQSDAVAEDPLEQQLLGLIRQAPGINRKGLHKALGGHVPAKAMVEALARLRDRRLTRAEVVATGGRPGECWFPADQPEATHVSIIGPDADVRTNKVEVGAGFELPSLARTERTGTATQDSSIVRTVPGVMNVPEVMPLAVEAAPGGGTLPRCECGSIVERPCDQFCPPCFDVMLAAI